MVGDEPDHLAAHVVAVERVHVQAVQERQAGATPASSWLKERMRPSMTSVVRGLAEVVREGADHQRHLLRLRQVVDALAHPVHHEQGVGPDVTFGMPLRLLRAPDQGRALGEELRQDAQRFGEREPDRGSPGAQQQLLDFAPDPFGGQIVERDRAAERDGALVERQVETGGELDRAQHPEAVIRERGGIHDTRSCRRTRSSRP